MAHGQNCRGRQQFMPTPETTFHSFEQTLALAPLVCFKHSFLVCIFFFHLCILLFISSHIFIRRRQ